MTQSTLREVSDFQTDQMMMNMPMKISDAASMLRKAIPKNDPPYTAEVKKLNNKRVDEWYERVLLKLADKDGTIPASRVYGCISYFVEGKEAASYQAHKAMMIEYPEAMVQYWIKTFKTASIKDLHEIGTGVVSNGWAIIRGAIRNYFAAEKWRLVYSKSEDPREWDRLANDNPHIMNGRPLPFGLVLEDITDMESKIQTLLRTPIQPQ